MDGFIFFLFFFSSGKSSGISAPVVDAVYFVTLLNIANERGNNKWIFGLECI